MVAAQPCAGRSKIMEGEATPRNQERRAGCRISGEGRTVSLEPDLVCIASILSTGLSLRFKATSTVIRSSTTRTTLEDSTRTTLGDSTRIAMADEPLEC